MNSHVDSAFRSILESIGGRMGRDQNTAGLRRHETDQHILARTPQEIPDFSQEEYCGPILPAELVKPIASLFAVRDMILQSGPEITKSNKELLTEISVVERAMYLRWRETL